VTQTVSLAIYQEFDVNLDVALAISALLVVVSGALLLCVKVVSGRAHSAWTLSPRFARSS
jgi:ABC-type sulfate transport system permease component